MARGNGQWTPRHWTSSARYTPLDDQFYDNYPSYVSFQPLFDQLDVYHELYHPVSNRLSFNRPDII